MTELMPALFLGHGSPMNAVESNAFSRAWIEMGRRLPRPRAILCISAHWETAGTRITAMPLPDTLYDFYGFPSELYQLRYSAPGDPVLARHIKETVADPVIHLDSGWGLDHGAWSVLRRMFPKADIPVLQLSLDFDRSPAFHYALGTRLEYLRSQGVLIVGSGNMVHNLRAMVWQDTAFDWAQAFDAALAERIEARDPPSLIDYHSLGEGAKLAVPTNEHYLPLLYVMAVMQPSDRIEFFCDRVTLGSISMRSVLIGSEADGV